jgi:thiamine biosynthesis lipoprotein
MTAATFRAMGTTISVHTTNSDSDPARRTFAEYEGRFSRFLPDSEISRINNSGSTRVEVSEDLHQLLTVAAELRDRTGRLIDVGVGAAVTAWGYDTTFTDVQDLANRPHIASPAVWYLDGGTLHRSPDTSLDVGGIAKGWTCDRIVEAGMATVVSAGGDMRSADPTLVADIVDHDGTIAAEVFVGVGALATSSTATRSWRVAGVPAHHVIDPRTMAPAHTPARSASVVAETAAEAEAGAKAVLLHGVDGLAWADTQPWIRQAVVIWHDGNTFGTTMRRAS